MTIQEFMQGFVIVVIATFVLAMVCAAWVFFVCFIGAIAFVITIVTGGIEVLAYIHQRIQLIGKGRN